MAVVKSAFEAQHGFKSPGFTVDEAGNVTLRSVTYTVTDEVTDVSGDYVVRDAGGNFTFDAEFQEDGTTLKVNPGVTLTRGSAYVFNLILRSVNQAGQTLGNMSLNIFSNDGTGYTLYNTGVSHTALDGQTKLELSEAQGQFSGKVTFTVPTNAPNELYYGDGDQTPIGILTIIDPTITGVGSFSSILTTGNVTAQGENAVITLAPTGSSGTVVINPSNGGTLSNMDVNALRLTTTDNVTINGENADIRIVPTGSAGTVLINPSAGGSIDNVNLGATTPGTVSATILTASAGTINNTKIGNTKPSTATFTVANVQAKPVSPTGAANKKYVDNRATALAIALGS
jgi:hypothetical protein|tara:strand:- start:499 stop:1527 length:1029 start_codon:yes stop_codon:yes gene_type:complete